MEEKAFFFCNFCLSSSLYVLHPSLSVFPASPYCVSPSFLIYISSGLTAFSQWGLIIIQNPKLLLSFKVFFRFKLVTPQAEIRQLSESERNADSNGQPNILGSLLFSTEISSKELELDSGMRVGKWWLQDEGKGPLFSWVAQWGLIANTDPEIFLT